MKPGLGKFGALGEAATLRLYKREDMAAHSAAKDENEAELARRAMEANGVNVAGILLTTICPDCGGSGQLAGEANGAFKELSEDEIEKLSAGQKAAYTKKLRKHQGEVEDAVTACQGCINSPVPGRVVVEVSLAEFVTAVFVPTSLR